MLTDPRGYKRNFDKNVQRELRCKVGDYEFVDSPLYASIVSDAPDEMPNPRYNKLLPEGLDRTEHSASYYMQ